MLKIKKTSAKGLSTHVRSKGNIYIVYNKSCFFIGCFIEITVDNKRIYCLNSNFSRPPCMHNALRMAKLKISQIFAYLSKPG